MGFILAHASAACTHLHVRTAVGSHASPSRTQAEHKPQGQRGPSACRLQTCQWLHKSTPPPHGAWATHYCCCPALPPGPALLPTASAAATELAFWKAVSISLRRCRTIGKLGRLGGSSSQHCLASVAYAGGTPAHGACACARACVCGHVNACVRVQHLTKNPHRPVCTLPGRWTCTPKKMCRALGELGGAYPEPKKQGLG